MMDTLLGRAITGGHSSKSMTTKNAKGDNMSGKLFVDLVGARDLPAMDLTGACFSTRERVVHTAQSARNALFVSYVASHVSSSDTRVQVQI